MSTAGFLGTDQEARTWNGARHEEHEKDTTLTSLRLLFRGGPGVDFNQSLSLFHVIEAL